MKKIIYISKNGDEKMKKRSLIILISLTVITTMLISTIILVNTNNSISELQEVDKKATVVDVTGLIIGEETEHEHVYKTTYDEENHWEECIYCNEKRNMIVHNFTTTWALRI